MKKKFKNLNKNINLITIILTFIITLTSLASPREMSKVRNLEIFHKQEEKFQESFDNDTKSDLNNYNANKNKDNINLDSEIIDDEKLKQDDPGYKYTSDEALTKNKFIIPTYSGDNATIINNNKTFFSKDFPKKEFESYSDLDKLGRVGVAEAFIGKSLMPKEKRGDIGMIKPSGWHTIRYDKIIKDKYLYNRCHLIAYMLTGENANPKNLMTGTRQFNVDGMLPYEDMVNKYIRKTNDKVWYRITPYFYKDDLVARGILMEAKSLKEGGLEYCVFVHNVQDGIEIDYRNGESKMK